MKGQADAQDEAKREALRHWVDAVNDDGGFGRWASAVSFGPADLATIIDENARTARARSSA